MSHHAAAFGLGWRSDLPLAGFDRRPAPGPIDASAGPTPVDVHRIAALPDRGEGRVFNRGWVYDDGVRFAWDDEVVFDMIAGERISYRPGAGWTGTMPASFYGTVAALTMAWRGIVPLHACAVELDGAAVLIAGRQGAGKSTLTAGLVAAGARFVADDLVGASIDGQGRITIARGRPTIRLHGDTAARIDTLRAEPVAGDPRGKWIAWPSHRSDAHALDLTAVVILEDRPEAPSGRASGLRLLDHLFRPGWLNAMPVQATLMRKALTIATTVPVIGYRSASGFGGMEHRQRAEDVIERVRSIRRDPICRV